MDIKEILDTIKSVKLCLMAHPDNEEGSEFADRIEDLEDIETRLRRIMFNPTITKENARSILENWWYLKVKGLGSSVNLPIKDEIVYSEFKEGSKHDFSFLYLIKIAYDLL